MELYLDHAGATTFTPDQMSEVSALLMSQQWGNPRMYHDPSSSICR